MSVKTIDEMTLEEIVDTYICNKNAKDPLKCIDCEKFGSCIAGKRAVQIIEEMTGGEKKKQKPLTSGEIRRMKAREEFVKALNSGDPIRYFMEVCGSPTRHAAHQRFIMAKKRYPDLYKEDEEMLKPDLDEEEVSLDSFLNEHSDFNEAITDVTDIPEEESRDNIVAEFERRQMYPAVFALNEKKESFLAKKNGILEKIFALQTEADECDKAIAIIDGAIELLRRE